MDLHSLGSTGPDRSVARAVAHQRMGSPAVVCATLPRRESSTDSRRRPRSAPARGVRPVPARSSAHFDRRSRGWLPAPLRRVRSFEDQCRLGDARVGELERHAGPRGAPGRPPKPRCVPAWPPAERSIGGGVQNGRTHPPGPRAPCLWPSQPSQGVRNPVGDTCEFSPGKDSPSATGCNSVSEGAVDHVHGR